MRRRAASAGVLACLVIGAPLATGATGPTTKPPSAATRSAQVELVLTAARGIWRPTGGPLNGYLVLRPLSPRMVVLPKPPLRREAVLSSGLVRHTWSRLFAKSRSGTTKGRRVTNAVVSFSMGGDRRVVPVQIELTGGDSTETVIFRVRPLKRMGHRPDVFGVKRRTVRDVTLLVDPTITSQIVAFWNSLLAHVFGVQIGVPPDPIPDAESFNSPSPSGYDFYFSQSGDAANTVTGPLDSYAWYSQTTGLFRRSGYTSISFQPASDGVFVAGVAGPRQELTNSAVWMQPDVTFTVTDMDVGGFNFRGTRTNGGAITNSTFTDMDATGASFQESHTPGKKTVRFTIKDSVFTSVRNDVSPDKPGAGKPFTMDGVDVRATTFQKSVLTDSAITDTTFAASRFQQVDFTGSTITGNAPETGTGLAGGAFQPTFNASTFEDVTFDRVTFENVSFRNVDLSGLGVTFDGATFKNVDFTGAQGLGAIDWTKVNVEGNVYGLGAFANELIDLRSNPEYLRSITFAVTTDAKGNKLAEPRFVAPEQDDATGLDIDPGSGLLIDPVSGGRLKVDNQGNLLVVDSQGEPLFDNAGLYEYRPGQGIFTAEGAPVAFDPKTGVPDGEP